MNVYEENYKLKTQIEEMKKDFSAIASRIVCIGGPLNDNIHRYSDKQLDPFREILSITRQY
jgi:hypothetical protein